MMNDLQRNSTHVMQSETEEIKLEDRLDQKRRESTMYLNSLNGV